MKDRVLDQFRQSIAKHRDDLMQWLNDTENKKSIHLGTAAVSEVLAEMEEFKALLRQIDDNAFGRCVVCDGEVELERLEQDYSKNICLDCYSEEQLRELERDLELAAKVQQQLLPACVPSIEGIGFAVKYASAHVVGGDYHDFFILKNGQQGFAIGDVMGKGLAASMLMSNLQASLRILGPDYDRPDQLTDHLNRLFRCNLKLIRFISLFIGALDVSNHKLYYCNAGHHAPLLWQLSDKDIRWLSPTAPAIGLIAEPEFKYESIPVSTGDLLVLYTDGLIEARNQYKQEFGEQRLAGFIKENHQLSAEDFVDRLWKLLKDYTAHNFDDTTLMAIKFR